MPNAKTIAAVLGAIAAVAILIPLVLAAAVSPAAESVSWVGPWLWEARALDVLVQGLVLLAAILGVVVVLGRQP